MASFQATIYEVQAAPERLSALDSQSLAKPAATAEGLLKVLSKFGPARILYRFDQPVNVFQETLTLGSNEPLVTGSRIDLRGEAINTITYHQVGAMIRLSAQTPPKEAKRKGPNVTMSASLAIPTVSNVEIAPGQKVPSIQTFSVNHSEELQFGRPRVMVAVNSSAPEAQQAPRAYLIRYLYNR